MPQAPKPAWRGRVGRAACAARDVSCRMSQQADDASRSRRVWRKKLGGLGRFHAGRAASRETQAGPTHVVLRRLMHGPVTAPYVTSRRVAYARAARMTHHARKTMAKKRGQEEVSFRHRLLYLCELAAPRRHQNRRARPAEPGSRLLVRDAARARPFLPPPWGVSRAKPEKNQAYLHRVNVLFTRRA